MSFYSRERERESANERMKKKLKPNWFPYDTKRHIQTNGVEEYKV